MKWSDADEGMGGSYFDYNHGNIGNIAESSRNVKVSNYEPHIQPQYYQEPRRPEYKSEEPADNNNSEFQPDYADLFVEKKDDEMQFDLLSDYEEDSKSSSSPKAVANALIQIPQKNIETLFRLPTLSVAQHLLNVYSLVKQE